MKEEEQLAPPGGQLFFVPDMFSQHLLDYQLDEDGPSEKKRKRPLPPTARADLAPFTMAVHPPQSLQPAYTPTPLVSTVAEAAASAAAPADDDKDLTPAERKERRKVRNRVSAQLHRERQRQHVDGLEQQVKIKDAELVALRAQVAALLAAKTALEQRVHVLEADAAATAALSAAADSAVCSAIAEVDFMDTECGGFDQNSSSDEATVLLGYSDSSAQSSSEDTSGDSSGLDSDMEDFVHQQQQQQQQQKQQAPPQPFLARMSSFDAFGRTHLDDVELDMTMFDDDRTLLQEEGITVESGSSNSRNSRGGVSVSSRAGGAASLAFLSLMCVCTFLGGKYANSGVPVLPEPAGRLTSAAHLETDAAANAVAVADAASLARRHRVLRAVGEGAAAAGNDDGDAEYEPYESSRRVTLQRSDTPSLHRQQQQQLPQRGWVFSPSEREPAMWRAATAARQGAAPWVYSRALDLFSSTAGGRWFGASAQSSMGAKVRRHYQQEEEQQQQRRAAGTAAAAGGTGHDVDIYRGRDVDLYRGSSAGDTGSSSGQGSAARTSIDTASPLDKSYMYCPSAHGMMGPRMIAHAAKVAFAAAPATPDSSDSRGGTEAELAERALVLQQQQYSGQPFYKAGSEGSGSGGSSSGRAGSGRDGEFVPPQQYMTFLLPSGSVDWGRMSDGMNSFNATVGESTGWLELGCEIKYARVVQDVSFTV